MVGKQALRIMRLAHHMKSFFVVRHVSEILFCILDSRVENGAKRYLSKPLSLFFPYNVGIVSKVSLLFLCPYKTSLFSKYR